MSSPAIHIGQFNDVTFLEWKASPFKAIHSDKNMHNVNAGDIFVGALKGQHESGFAFVCTVKGKCVQQDLLDVDVYKGENAHYNKYHFAIDRLWLLPALMPFAEVAAWCGKTLDDRTNTNIFKPTLSRRKPYYKGNDEQTVVDRFRVLIESLMNSPTPPAPLAVAAEVPFSSSSSAPVAAASPSVAPAAVAPAEGKEAP